MLGICSGCARDEWFNFIQLQPTYQPGIGQSNYDDYDDDDDDGEDDDDYHQPPKKIPMGFL